MKVVLLCAGYATRLYPLTKNRPKPLLPVAGRPILGWILESLKPLSEIDGVYVVTNHKFAPNFKKWTQGLQMPWPVEAVDDQTLSNETRLGAIGDLNYVLTEKKIGQEDILVIAGDNFFDFDLNIFLSFALCRRPHGSIAVYDVKDRELARQYGLVGFKSDGLITEFFEKPENPPTTLASCGLYWLPRETRVLLDRYLASGNNPDQPGHYMRWLAENDRLYATALEGRWLDIGDKASYEKANQLISAL